MEDDWFMVYSSTKQIDAQQVQNALEDYGIKVVALDKSGNPYFILGEVELYVPLDQAEKAIHFIDAMTL